MRKLFGIIAIMASSGATTNHALAQAQRPQQAVIFTCKTASGKVVKFTNQGRNIGYSYGKPGAPDLAFSVPRSASSITDGSDNIGSGSWYMTHEVTVTFSGTVYTGWWSFHRASHAEEAGIIVERGGTVVARTACQSNIQMNLDRY